MEGRHGDIGLRALMVIALACMGCGDDYGGGPYGDLPSCEDYCQRLRTSGGGCASDVENCANDCELWRREHVDMGCEAAFDELLACTAGIDEVCEANKNECNPEWDRWADCSNQCDIASVGDVSFSPPCTPQAPCASGTELTMSYQGPLNCTNIATLTCAGEPTHGFLPASDGVSSGTIELQCTQASGCGLQTDTAFLNSSGGATVITCTP